MYIIRNKLYLCLYLISLSAMGQFEGDVGIEIGYDSNVSVDEIDLITPENDNFLTTRLGLAYHIPLQHEDEIKLAYRLSVKHYSDNNQFDLQTHFASVGYDFKVDKITYGLTARYIDSSLDSDSFLQLAQLSPSISWFVTKQHFVRTAYTFIDKSLEQNPTRDARTHELAADYYYFINGLHSYLIAGVKLRQEDAQDDLFDYYASQLRLAYQKRLAFGETQLKVMIDWRIRRRDYKDEILPTIMQFREDTRQSTELSIDWEIDSNWTLQWQAEYVDNNSNLTSVNYSQWVSTLAANYAF